MPMKTLALLTVILVITSLPMALAAKGGSITYFDNSPSNPEYEEEYQIAGKAIEMETKALDEELIMPEGVHVISMLDECGQANAFYDPSTRSVVICYELVKMIKDFAMENYRDDITMSSEAIASVLTYVFLHEAGHMMIHVFNLPVLGKEEDSADFISLIILIEGGKKYESIKDFPLYIADWYQYMQELRTNEGLAFWDTHSLDEQRKYNTLCLLYGSNTDGYQFLVDTDLLPYERAKSCTYEYEKANQSWNKILQPYVVPEFGTIAVLITGFSTAAGMAVFRIKRIGNQKINKICIQSMTILYSLCTLDLTFLLTKLSDSLVAYSDIWR